MRKIHTDLEGIENSLWPEETAFEHHFFCTKRAKVLAQIKDAMHNGVSLIVLTGEQGSGKTMICRALEEELAESWRIVFFPQAVDSFEEVTHFLAMQLGLEEEIGGDGDLDQAEEQIVDFLLGESVDLLVIFDEAENIFLATLERIRSMLDRLCETGAGVQILLAGRHTLLDNCKQVAIGDFQKSGELHFDLDPLSDVETADYLRNCVVWSPEVDISEVFTDAVVSEIFSYAQGNISKTNILGQEAVNSHGDTSYSTLLDSVKEGVETLGANPVVLKYGHLLKRYSVYLPWVGGAACCVLLLLFLFRPGGDENGERQAAVQSAQKETVPVKQEEQVKPPEENVLPATEPAEDKQMEDQPGGGEQAGEEKPTAAQVQEEARDSEVTATVAEPGREELSDQNVDQEQNEVEQSPPEEESDDTARVEEEAVPVVGGNDRQTTEQDTVEVKEIEGARSEGEGTGKNVVLLRRPQNIKKKLGGASGSQQEGNQLLSPTQKDVSRISSSSRKADELYEARLSAGSGWLKRDRKGMYTVQLMVLTSPAAEKNLKTMLSQVDYRQESGNFYILKKTTSPQSIFVFYGEYPSLERAHLAQDSLPEFLRNHKPYILSINGAVSKVTR